MNEATSTFKTIAFDLDGTLAASKSAITPTTSALLCQLLQRYNVAVVSGGSFTQFQKQLVANLKCSEGGALAKLFLFPTNGSALYVFEGSEWRQVYEEPLTPDEKYRIQTAWKAALAQSGVTLPNPSYGPVMEDRGTQITFSACGQEAPISVKEGWDPDQQKRIAIRKILAPLLPGLSVSFGGMTSVDITREGVDKAYAMQKMMDYLHETKDDIMFIGDKLEPGGNDFAARRSGVQCISVANPSETEGLIKKLIS